MSTSNPKIHVDLVRVFVFTFIGLGSNYVYNILLARFLGPQDFGAYSIGLSIFNIIVAISIAGQDQVLLRFVPRCIANNEPSKVPTLILFSLSIVAGLSAFIALVFWLVSHSIATDVFKDAGLTNVFRAFCIGIPLYVGGVLVLSALQAFHVVKERMFAKYLLEPGIKIVLTFIAFYFGFKSLGAIYSYTVALGASFLAAIVYLNRYTNFRRRTVVFRQEKLELLNYCLPIVAANILNTAASKSDILLIAFFMSAAEAGVYAIVFQTAAIMSIVLLCIESVFTSRFSKYISEKNISHLGDNYKRALRWTIMACSPFFLLAFCFPNELLSVFGRGYEDGFALVQILFLAQLINLSTGSANSMLLMFGKSKIVMFNSIAYSMLLVVLNTFMVQRFGVVGVAISVAIAMLLLNVLRLLEVYYYLRINPYSYASIKILAALFVTICLHFLLLDAVLEYSLPNAFIVLCIFILLLYLSGLDDEDIQMVNTVRKTVKELATSLSKRV